MSLIPVTCQIGILYISQGIVGDVNLFKINFIEVLLQRMQTVSVHNHLNVHRVKISIMF